MLEINFFLADSKFLLPGVKVGSKTNITDSENWWPVRAHLPSVQVVVRFKTKQNPIWSKALTMPCTIWNYVYTSSPVIFKGKLASTSHKLL